MKKKVLIAISIIGLLSFVGCEEQHNISGIQQPLPPTMRATKITRNVEGEIISKKREDGGIIMIPIIMGSMTTYMSQTQPDEYRVTIQYGNLQKTIDNRDIFNAYNIGDKIPISDDVEYDDNGNVKNETIRVN